MIDFKGLISYVFFGLTLFFILKRPQSYAVFIILGITLISSSFLIYKLLAKKEISFSDDRSKSGLLIRYVIFSMIFLVLLPIYKGNYNPNLMIAILVMIWVNDSFAFLVGKNFGKRKLFVSVSPKNIYSYSVWGVCVSICERERHRRK